MLLICFPEIVTNIPQLTEIATNIPQSTEVKILTTKVPLSKEPLTKASSKIEQKSFTETKAVSRSIGTRIGKTESGLPTTMQLFTTSTGKLELTLTKKKSATNAILPAIKKTTSKPKSSISIPTNVTFTPTNTTFTPTNALQKISAKVNTTGAILISSITEGNKNKAIQRSLQIDETKSISIQPLKLENVETLPISVFSLEERRAMESLNADLLNETLGNFTKNATIESMADEMVTAAVEKINGILNWSNKIVTPLLAILIIVILSFLSWLIFFLW